MLKLGNVEKKEAFEKMDVCTSASKPSTVNSLSEADRNAIDQQNNEIISKMTPAEIEEERQKLLKNLGIFLLKSIKKHLCL